MRRPLRLVDGPVAVNPRRELPVGQGAAEAGSPDPWPAALPGWRFRNARFAPPAEPARVPLQAPAAAPRPSPLPSPPPPPAVAEQFLSDRRAARYAPVAAEFLVGDERPMPVKTVSLSGLAVLWDDAALPAVGTTIDGIMRTGGPHGDFPAALQVARLEPGRGLVAGRFVGLRGRAIDRLLGWLAQLDRDSADGG